MAKGPGAAQRASRAGDPPSMPSTADHVRSRVPSGPRVPNNRTARKRLINLAAVADVLIEEGLDPTREIARVLKQPYDSQTGTGLDDSTRARALLELMQYVHPKKKAIEVQLDDQRELSEEQIRTRIAALLAKASAKGEK